MQPRIIKTILRKELLDTLRDKRALVMMVGVPILLYPLLMIVGFQVAMLQHTRLDEATSHVGVVGMNREVFAGWIADMPKIDVVELANDPEAALGAGEVDALVVETGDQKLRLDEGKTAALEVHYDATEFSSQEAAARLAVGLDQLNKKLQTERLAAIGVALEYVTPLEVTQEDMATPVNSTGTILGLLLPMFMVIMLALGAFYPAVDLTAGEKERGTFETLLASPVSKLEVVVGKFAAVFFLSMLTGMLNLASMGLTFALLLTQLRGMLEEGMAFQIEVPFLAFPAMLLVMIPLALFVSAAIMSVAVLARSFKEAQHYLTPVFLAITLPVFVAAFPGIKLAGMLHLFPIANVVLLFKDLLTGQGSALGFVLVFGSTAIYASLALYLAVWLFQREDVILAEEGGLPLSASRADFRPRNALTPGAAVFYFCFVLLVMFYGGNILQAWNLLWGLLAMQWLLLLVPALVTLWYVRARYRTALFLRGLSLTQLVAVLITGVCWVLLIIQVSVWQNRVLPMPGPVAEAFQEILVTLKNQPLPVILFVLALSPAICEEVVFRGVILSGLRTRLGAMACVLIVGVMFGIIHFSVYRFVPTALTGMLLTWLVLRTGSLLAGMVVHLLNNSLSLLIEAQAVPYLRDWVDAHAVATQGVPWYAVAAALAGLAGGLMLLDRATPRERLRPIPVEVNSSQ
ncbi:MAG: CPBP family intramembrane metalloprotease [Candidatus Hydrogenedentes bacterium]|nr:CPBP family intramembrane metalloprotease [Candidatus Hydrogenedentota bacterium]